MRAPRPGDVVGARQIDIEHGTIEKPKGLQRLTLRTGADLAVHGQIGQELPNALRAQVPGMPPLMKPHLPSNPLQVDLLGAISQVLRAQLFSRHLQQSRPIRHVPYPHGGIGDIAEAARK